MATTYEVRDMTKEEYLAEVTRVFGLEEGEILMDDDGFTTADGRWADEPGNPLPGWFGDLPWDFSPEDVAAKAEDGEADEVYVQLDGNGDRLWELPKH